MSHLSNISRGALVLAVLIASACGDAATPSSPTTTTRLPPTVTAIAPASGSVDGGIDVTISGTGFTNVQSVLFGTTPATTYVVSFETSITATAPGGAAPGATDVVVVTEGGSSATSDATKYTWIPNQLVDLTLAASSVTGGAPIRGTATVTLPAPSNGIRLPIVWKSTPAGLSAVRVPAAVYIAKGEVTGTFQIDTFYVSTPESIEMSLEHWGVTKTVRFTVGP
ncbi:MAG: IPT/TIG domain-containing protein [Acidobacteria bacterium]|nr:IPT/TIG domain-containing protein [Acidobacteriota bacterium]